MAGRMITVSRSLTGVSSPLQVAHVLAVQVDVDEAVQTAIGGQQLIAQPAVIASRGLADHLADVSTGRLDLLLPVACVLTENRREANRGHERMGRAKASSALGAVAPGRAQHSDAARRAIRVAAQLHFAERAVERVPDEQPADQRVADARASA